MVIMLQHPSRYGYHDDEVSYKYGQHHVGMPAMDESPSIPSSLSYDNKGSSSSMIWSDPSLPAKRQFHSMQHHQHPHPHHPHQQQYHHHHHHHRDHHHHHHRIHHYQQQQQQQQQHRLHHHPQEHHQQHRRQWLMEHSKVSHYQMRSVDARQYHHYEQHQHQPQQQHQYHQRKHHVLHRYSPPPYFWSEDSDGLGEEPAPKRQRFQKEMEEERSTSTSPNTTMDMSEWILKPRPRPLPSHLMHHHKKVSAAGTPSSGTSKEAVASCDNSTAACTKQPLRHQLRQGCLPRPADSVAARRHRLASTRRNVSVFQHLALPDL